MNLKNKLWWLALRILKRWSRAGLMNEVQKELSKFEKPTVVSVGGFGPVDKLLKVFIEDLGGAYFTFDIDSAHNPDVLGDITEISKHLMRMHISPDVIIALEVLEHVPRFDMAISSCHDVLQENGMLIFSTPWITPIHDRPNDYFRFTPQAIALHLGEYKNVKILARGTFGDSVIMLLLRGLFSGGLSGKFLLVVGAVASLLLPLPKVSGNLNQTDSCIGYISFGSK